MPTPRAALYFNMIVERGLAVRFSFSRFLTGLTGLRSPLTLSF